MNGSFLKEKIKATPASYLGKLLAETGLENQEIINRLFLRFLCRPPVSSEAAMALKLVAQDRKRGFEDLQWLLANKIEFSSIIKAPRQDSSIQS